GHPLYSARVNQAGQSCSPGAQYFAGNCYYPPKALTTATWEEAETKCNQLSDENDKQTRGHLASLHSIEEAQFLSELISNVSQIIWLGLKLNCE
ncbi:unnamed protein product, partial [Protopolystoma xenopodis]